MRNDSETHETVTGLHDQWGRECNPMTPVEYVSLSFCIYATCILPFITRILCINEIEMDLVWLIPYTFNHIFFKFAREQIKPHCSVPLTDDGGNTFHNIDPVWCGSPVKYNSACQQIASVHCTYFWQDTDDFPKQRASDAKLLSFPNQKPSCRRFETLRRPNCNALYQVQTVSLFTRRCYTYHYRYNVYRWGIVVLHCFTVS